MYSVSAAYLAALALPVHKYRLTGTVGTEAFDEANIVSGSLSVSNKVSEGSEIKLGSVYTGELKGKFTGMSIARGSWVGKNITLSEGLLIDPITDTYEDVPLGIFTVAEANHTAEGVEVTAYDAMTNFDKTRNDLTDTGTAYAFLTLMCQKCGVTLGSTLADIQTLPNGTETFSIYAENDIETWRDLLSWIAQTLGAVATIGRDGKLYLRQYSMTAAATIDETHRFTGCSFSDFVTYYTGMSVVDIALRQTEYKSEVVDDGLTYNLGSNPLVQGHYEYVQEIIDDFSNVALTPFNAQMLGGAIYDLCDCLTFSGGIAAGATCGVMGYTWKYNGAYSVKGFGANPALATAKSKTQKELEALYNTVGQEINEMSVVQNSTAVTIAENTETSILTYNFEVTQEENTTMVDVSVVMTATATEQLVGEIYTLGDIVAALTFYVDNSQVTVYDPTFIVDEGKDTMTFNFSLSGLSVGAHEFDIRLRVNGGTGSIAVGDVHELLWGYGITFEVYIKGIEVSQMPDRTTFYVGESLDYTGVGVDAVYNNGLRDDVTAQCTFDPVAGTVLDEYDIGTLNVDVNYDTFGTEMPLEVARIRLMLGTQANETNGFTIEKYGNDLSALVDLNSSSSPYKLLKKDITFSADGVPQISNSSSLYQFPDVQYNRYFLNVGTRVVSVSQRMLVSSVETPSYYYDFSTSTGGQFTVTYSIEGSANTVTDLKYNGSGNPYAVDGHIVLGSVQAVDSGGTTINGYAVGKITGANLAIRIVPGSTLNNYYNRRLIYVGNYEFERINEQKYYAEYDNGIVYLKEMKCNGQSVSFDTIWSASTILPGLGYMDFIPSGETAVLGASWSDDGDTVLGVYIVDISTGTAEWHFSRDRDNDPIYMYYMEYNNALKQGIYLSSIEKYIVCRNATDSEKTTVLYMSENLLDWTVVTGIDNDQDAVADAVWVYAPSDTGVLVQALKNRNYGYRYLSQLRFSNLE